MRPEQLKSPFTWDERQVLINDRIWYVPAFCAHYDKFNFPGWSHPDIFGNNNPVHVEYCSGNGAWIAAKALANPHINWVALERKFTRVRKIWSKLKNLNLNNLIVVCGEGYNVTSRYFPANTISEVFINFPDPWPKKRHAKNRIIQSSFVKEMNRILSPNGSLTFVTDDAPYSEWTIEAINNKEGFQSSYPNPFYVTDHPDYGSSYFDELWREKGRIIRYHKFDLKTS
jgi:tRNA (guanine-N7-)-methyltransferase